MAFTSFVTSPSASGPRCLRVSAACASTAERTTAVGSLRIASSPASSSLYEVLGIQMGATCQEIKTAYRRLARILHPDVVATATDGPNDMAASSDRFRKLHEAYETLSDPEKRADYDRSLFRRGRPMSSPFAMSATASSAASGFTGYTGRRWETDQCW